VLNNTLYLASKMYKGIIHPGKATTLSGKIGIVLLVAELPSYVARLSLRLRPLLCKWPAERPECCLLDEQATHGVDPIVVDIMLKLAKRCFGSPAEAIDCVVIGAGAIGLAVARSLAQEQREVLVLEKDGHIGTGISSRNSEGEPDSLSSIYSRLKSSTPGSTTKRTP